ncbi:UNVERIFIED_CONTAM: hypothetical protein H355_002397 [Colinus virginianus]|nr:hypothetical protein H355_002397 [Colinus virginianus]
MAEPARPPLPAPLPRPAAFFGAVAPGNPVVDSLEAELRDVLGFLRRLRGAGDAEPQRHELHRRGANTLFNIWIKYKPRLPDWYYNDKLLKVGDSLAQIKEYKLALLQCYGRYLQQFISVNPDDITDDENQFKTTFFPDGFRDKNAFLTFHALQERNVCIYQMVCSSDGNLQKQESLQTCFRVLSSIRLTMQVALPQQNLCWLIYNGTIHIYTICRHLMLIGQSAKVFARRGLIQIDELKQLEDISSSQKNSETRKIFREATIKMSVMIFKRAVYESRRKPKSYYRPKLKVNLKEAQNLPWPRTTTEQLLMEMFDSTAAQFLAVLEALSDSSRRVLHPAPPVPDEPEIRDVISELCLAGLGILSGNSIKNQNSVGKYTDLSYFFFLAMKEKACLKACGVSSADVQGDCTNEFGIINASSTLLQLILTGEKRVSGEAAVKFVKLAFNYEEWDVFDSAIVFVTNFLQLIHPNVFKYRFVTRNNVLPFLFSPFINAVADSLEYGEPSHDLLILATTVFSCISSSKQWIYVLWILNEVILNVPDTDVVMVAEITLHLTAVLENTADCASKSKKKAVEYVSFLLSYFFFYEKGKRNVIISEDQTCDIPEILMRSPTEQLQLAYENLEKTINEMNKSRLMTFLPDGKSIFDNCCMKKSLHYPMNFMFWSPERRE